MAQMQVFVSHSHEDDAFCRSIVQGLRDAGADVWYDEHNMGSGQLLDTIERELRARPVFVLVLSPAALRSQWVRDETTWAYLRYKRDPTRIMLPVLAQPLSDEDDIWMFMQNFKRIEAAGVKPYPTAEAVQRLLLALALMPMGTAAAPVSPQPSERIDDLLVRGKALLAQYRPAEALPLFERAASLLPSHVDAWFYQGRALIYLRRFDEALSAVTQALALDAEYVPAWASQGGALLGLKRYDEALIALSWALTLDPESTDALSNMGVALTDLERYEEALASLDRALSLDPNDAAPWCNRGSVLLHLERYEEALAAYDHAVSLQPNALGWNGKGIALDELERHEEALAAYDQALAVAPTYAKAWHNKAIALRALGRIAEAKAAERRAKELTAPNKTRQA